MYILCIIDGTTDNWSLPIALGAGRHDWKVYIRTLESMVNDFFRRETPAARIRTMSFLKQYQAVVIEEGWVLFSRKIIENIRAISAIPIVYVIQSEGWSEELQLHALISAKVDVVSLGGRKAETAARLRRLVERAYA